MKTYKSHAHYRHTQEKERVVAFALTFIAGALMGATIVLGWVSI